MDVWCYDLSLTYLFLGRYEDAVAAVRRAISLTPDLDASYIVLAAAQVQLGRLDDARAAIRQAQSLGTNFTVSNLKISIGHDSGAKNGEHMTAVWEGLRQLGLPE